MPKSKALKKLHAKHKIFKQHTYGLHTRRRRNAVLASKRMQAVPAFVILGHGEEDTTVGFDERSVLPEGYTLVTLSQCGAVTDEDIVQNFINAASSLDPAMIRTFKEVDKKTIESLLGQKIHIYTEGQKIPALYVSFFLDWVRDDGWDTMKSGVYTLPVTPDPKILKPYAYASSAEKNALVIHNTFSPKMMGDVLDLYTDSRFPLRENVHVVANRGVFQQSVTAPLSAVFNAANLGPGVYYYIVCRDPKEKLDSFIKQYVDANISERMATDNNIFPLLPSIISQIEPYAEKERVRLLTGKPIWSSGIATAPNRLRNLYTRVIHTRKRSNEQQAEIYRDRTK